MASYVETYRAAMETRAQVYRVAVDLHDLSNGILLSADSKHLSLIHI